MFLSVKTYIQINVSFFLFNSFNGTGGMDGKVKFEGYFSVCKADFIVTCVF